jgi:hypothetical protein
MYILIPILIILVLVYFFNFRENYNNLNFGFIGDHLKNKEYNISSKYNFNLGYVEKKELRRIVNPIIKKINQDLNVNFHFLEYEHVTTQYFKNYKRFVIDFFIHETSKYYDKRLIADVTLKNKTITVNNLTIGNGKIEKTSNNIASVKFDNKIISDNNLKYDNTIIGNENNSLEYHILENKQHNFIKDKNFTKWILSENNLVNKKWPCRLQGEYWDVDSIMNTTQENKNCSGINTTFRTETQQPNFLPSFKITNKNENYNWLWGNSRGTGTNMFSGGSG